MLQEPLPPSERNNLPGRTGDTAPDTSTEQASCKENSPPIDASFPTRLTPEAGLSQEESKLLNTPLPTNLGPVEMEEAWATYQQTIAGLLLRMGRENNLAEAIKRIPLVPDREAIYSRIALIPKLGKSALHNLENHGVAEVIYRIAGECSLMELSAAAGYRTFCLPKLVEGLLKTDKMRDRSMHRMFDTFEFLKTMIYYPMNDPKTLEQLERTNHLHEKYGVAGSVTEEERDLFKYIALNMFYIGPSARADLTPQERHAICGLTALVTKRMGHALEGTVKDFDEFIHNYEATQMFDLSDESELRKRAIEIARASQEALEKIPTTSKTRIHSYVPERVKKILEIE